MAVVSLMMLFLISCGDATERLKAAAEMKALMKESLSLPPLPEDCRVWVRGGVSRGERMDIAIRRLDDRLNSQNLRIQRCAEWSDKIRTDLLQMKGVR